MSTCRVIEGLKWVRVASEAPFGRSRARGAKAQGLRYERALARQFPHAVHGQWLEFEDRNGRGFCQPDLMWAAGNFLVVLEAKYTWVPEGHSQISRLYRPVLEMLYGLPVLGVVVCKKLMPGMPYSAVGGLEDAIRRARAGAPAIWQWLGNTSVGTRLAA